MAAIMELIENILKVAKEFKVAEIFALIKDFFAGLEKKPE